MPVASVVRPGDEVSSVDYGAVERALTPAQRAALTDFCCLLGIPRERWGELSTLRTLFVAIAVQQLAETLQASTDLSWNLALSRAADQLGVNVFSHARQMRRWVGQVVPDSLPRTADAFEPVKSQTTPVIVAGHTHRPGARK